MLEAGLVPGNKQGKQNDLEAAIEMATEEAAVNLYKDACDKMLHPGMWRSICGDTGAAFGLTDIDGALLNRPAETGDYIRINIPGPGPATGEGYDWVRVATIESASDEQEGDEACGMQLKPASAPVNRVEGIAHFFDSGASSTFIIRRRGRHVTAAYHGRNELPNVGTGNVADNIRNAIVASGALAGLSELQWQMLLNAFLGIG